MPPRPAQGPTGGKAEAFSHDALATGVRKGDPDAVERLRLRVRRIMGYGRLGIPAEAREDLEQEIMTQLWQTINRPAFDPEAGLWGLVELVTTRRCIDWLRTRKPAASQEADLHDRRMNPLEDALAGERTRFVSKALATLGDPCRELIALRIGDEVSFREISARLGKSEGSLRIQMYRCVRKLRSRLEGLMDAQAKVGQDGS